ncbi:MAG: hypothetical protein IT323_04785 [Anaerolineae bacterium]|nr:hypothetical protein [Anaerolineae bacterium]
MHRRLRVLLTLVVLAFLATACIPPELGGLVVGCDHVQGGILVPADTFAIIPPDLLAMMISVPVYVEDMSGNVLGSGSLQVTPVDADNVAFWFDIPVNPVQSEGTFLLLVAEDGSPIFGEACSGAPITSFNPRDGRVDPRPGDRLAIYCNQPPGSVDVWGVDDKSKGFRLATFTFADLTAAGLTGIYITVEPNGTISLSMDEQGNLWAAWNGGQYNADGQPGHGFAKGFRCN